MAKDSLKALPQGANGKAPINWKKIGGFFWKAFRLATKCLAGAVVLTFMAELAPGLRETLPHFYEFVDLLTGMLEYISSSIFH